MRVDVGEVEGEGEAHHAEVETAALVVPQGVGAAARGAEHWHFAPREEEEEEERC